MVFVLAPLSTAAPITSDNGCAEPLPKGGWDIELHYGYYDAGVIKNTAYWAYTQGNGHMDDIDEHTMKYISQVVTLETYHAFTDRLTAGFIFPYLLREVKKQPYAGGTEVDSDGIGNIGVKACLNILNPRKDFLGASMAGAFVLPAGDRDADPLLGYGRYELCSGAVFTKLFNEKFKAHLTLSYTWMFENKDCEHWGMYSRIDPGDEFHYGLAGEYRIAPKINLVCELSGWAAPESRDRNGNKISYTDYNKIEFSPGVQYNLNQHLAVEAALKIPLRKDQDFDYDLAPVIGMVYVF